MLFITLIKYISLFLFLLTLNYDYGYNILIIPLGFFIATYFGIGLEFACEISFPTGEAISTGGLIFGGCIYSFLTS